MRRPLYVTLLAAGISLPAPLPAAEEPTALDPVVVTANRDEQALDDTAAAITRIDEASVDAEHAAHPNEIFDRVPGTWISRGSGQEHLTAIRSPVLTGAGACGAFLYLEDGIPVRPAGLCNVNQLFEINTEQAGALEILRGPGSAVHGSNAVHGVINVLPRKPGRTAERAGLLLGEHDLYRVSGMAGSDTFNAYGFLESSGSIQRDAGHEQGKLNLGWQGTGWRAHLAGTKLDQDTAGYILGEDAYRDPSLRFSNPNPEAFRKAEALRAWAVIDASTDAGHTVVIRPFARYSDMDFLQHFLPGKPLEENGHVSAGVIGSIEGGSSKFEWRSGVDLEYADGWLRQFQDSPVQIDSAFLRETRPLGKHYDYRVRQQAASPWLHLDIAATERTRIATGLRVDSLKYDYENRMASGNTRQDGSECDLGGCIYNRPADRTDAFLTVSPRLQLRHRVSESSMAYAGLSRGFRIPQATELYRLQRGQDVADLEPVRIDSLELGWRSSVGAVDYSMALFTMEKRNGIYRDADGFNRSNARTDHTGVEVELDWQLASAWRLGVAATVARHTYDFDYLPDSGEQIRDGDDVDTAPRTLGNVQLQWQATQQQSFTLEWQHMGEYFLDAENSAQYPGHDLLHFRWRWQAGSLTWDLRIDNVLDTEYAERADFAFGEYRYFPGWPRRLQLAVSRRFGY